MPRSKETVSASSKDPNAFVCFCVEGPSDIKALSRPFSSLLRKYAVPSESVPDFTVNVQFRTAKTIGKQEAVGDLTTQEGVTPENIEKIIYKQFFQSQDTHSDWNWSDVTTVIHIVDIDGAYISDDDIRLYTDEEEELARRIAPPGKKPKPLYFPDHIAILNETTRKMDPLTAFRDRNQRKRAILDHMISMDTLTAKGRTVNYRVYYFSSNLDHFLYGTANLPGFQKSTRATEFSNTVDDADSLRTFFAETAAPYCPFDDYEQSWKEIRKGCNSVSRLSNINLLIDRICTSPPEEWLAPETEPPKKRERSKAPSDVHSGRKRHR